MAYGPAPENAGEAEKWLDDHDRRFGLFIGGEWKTPDGGAAFESFNPATARPLAEIAQAGASEVDAAVAAANAAQPGWAKLTGHARARLLYALARLVQRHARLLAVVETLDNGKPIRESRDIDIPLVARHFYYHAGWAQIADKEYPGHTALGVAGQIIPWNFPLLMLAWKIALALATGNTVVLKPAEQTSLTALLFAELCVQAGLPPGVVNIVTGDGAVGELITAHPDIDKIAFTGSTEVGRKIRETTAGSGKKLSLELGGKSPFIAFDDADLDSAVEGLVDAIWFNQGQVCCAGSRLLVQESIADAFLAKTRARMANLVVGDPLEKGVDIGAIVSSAQLTRIRDLVALGEREGGTVWQPDNTCPTQGWFYPPTLITDVAPATTVAQEEIFGPVLTAMTFRNPSEAVALANNTRYGLAASVWSENINLALDIAPKLASGTVWINATNLFDASCGFGGGGCANPASGAKAAARDCRNICAHPGRRAFRPMKRRAPRRRCARLSRARNCRSTGPPSIISAARKSARIQAIPHRYARPMARYWERLERVTARISARRSKRPTKPPAGAKRAPTTAPRCSITSRRISKPAPASSAPG